MKEREKAGTGWVTGEEEVPGLYLKRAHPSLPEYHNGYPGKELKAVLFSFWLKQFQLPSMQDV